MVPGATLQGHKVPLTYSNWGWNSSLGRPFFSCQIICDSAGGGRNLGPGAPRKGSKSLHLHRNLKDILLITHRAQGPRQRSLLFWYFLLPLLQPPPSSLSAINWTSFPRVMWQCLTKVSPSLTFRKLTPENNVCFVYKSVSVLFGVLFVININDSVRDWVNYSIPIQ